MGEVCGAGGEEGESVVNVSGGEETTERKLLCVAMFDVVCSRKVLGSPGSPWALPGFAATRCCPPCSS